MSKDQHYDQRDIDNQRYQVEGSELVRKCQEHVACQN